ncbi:MAG: hypothetical protein U0Z70_02230 [Thermomicrobiales bacterium]
MSDVTTIKVLRLSDGRVFQEMEDGTLRPMVDKTDRARLDAMSEAEIEANALSDPDNPPMTEEELARLKPVLSSRRVRAKLHLSREAFAEMFNLPIGTVQNWESGRCRPGTAAMNYLRMIQQDPEAVIAVLKHRTHAYPQDEDLTMLEAPESNPAILNGLDWQGMIEQDVNRPGRGYGRLVAEQIPVWALIGRAAEMMGTTDPDTIGASEVMQAVAYEYDVPLTSVIAAFQYHRNNRGPIDAILEANAAVLGR